MLPCGSMRRRKGTSEMGHQETLPTTDGSVTCSVSCMSLFPPVCWWVPLQIHKFVMRVLFLEVKHLHDNRSTGKYQLIEWAACLPSSFAPEFSSWPPNSSLSEGRATTQQVRSNILLSTPPAYIRWGNQLAISRNIS